MRFIIILIIFITTEGYCSDKQSLKTLLKADQINNLQNADVITASGNVELTKGDNTLFTNKLSYNKNSQYISADGEIKIKNYDIGNIVAKTANIKSDFTSGSFDDAVIIFNNGSYIQSPRINRKNESETIFNSPIFSICPNDEVKNNNILAGTYPETLSIASAQTTIDRSTDSIKTKDGIIKIYNFPVFYIPYLKIPIPSSKRKSGFLHPSYVNSTRLGFGLKIPYYFDIATDKDLTIALQSHPSKGHLILNNKYRQLTQYGSYDINLDLANNKPKNNDLIRSAQNQQNVRWRLKSTGDLILSNNLGLNFKIDNVGDKDYLIDYGNQFNDYSISEVNLDYIKNQEYASIKTIKIQELGINANNKEPAPIALPVINYYNELKPKNSWFGQTYSLLTNSTIISRASGLQYRRLSFKPEIRIPYNLSGNLFEFSSGIQSNLYNLNNSYSAEHQDYNFRKNIINYYSATSLKWSLPMLTKYKNNTLILEPLATITSSSNGINNTDPNEDTNNMELTQNNLFLSNRFTGLDRNEIGKRISYGFKSSLFNRFGQFDLGLGQSRNKHEEPQDIVIRGFNNTKSNIVGELSYKTPTILSINYNFQLNESNYVNDINELGASLNFGNVIISSNYIVIRKTTNTLGATTTIPAARKQVDLNISAYITKQLVFSTTKTHDFLTDRAIYSKYDINYNGCCVAYGISFSESNPTYLAKPQKSTGIQFTIKY